MTYPVADDPDGLAALEPSKKVLERFLPSASVLAMGPGMGQSAGLRELVEWVVRSRSRSPPCSTPTP